jgi:hypothetical protein
MEYVALAAALLSLAAILKVQYGRPHANTTNTRAHVAPSDKDDNT